MLRVLDGKFLAVFMLLLVSLACSGLDSQESVEAPQKELVKLPSEVRDQEQFQEAASESALILVLTSDNKLYQEQMQVVKDPQFDLSELKSTANGISWEELPRILKGVKESAEAEKKIVYLKIDADAAHSIVVPLLRAIRDAGITAVGLLTAKKPDWSARYKGLFNIDLLTPVNTDPGAEIMPNPLRLIAVLGEGGNLKLNGEEHGTISDTQDLEKRLSSVLKEREEQLVLREGTNEIETEVNLMAADATKYGDVVKLIDALKRSGAAPIVLVLDESDYVLKVKRDYDLPQGDMNSNSDFNQE